MVRRRSALGLPPHCERFTSKGITYVYARLPGGPRIRLLSPLGTEAFTHEYRNALDKLQGPVGAAQAVKGSVRAIATAFLASDAFLALKKDGRAKYRREIERFAEKNGHRMLGEMAAEDVRAMMRKISSPHTARLWRQALSTMCAWAQAESMVRRNPFREVEAPEMPQAKPHRRWMPEHIEAFRRKHPTGTVERLALEFLICTMARGCSDVSRFGRANIKNGNVVWIAAKNGEEMTVPISRDLATEIAAAPHGDVVDLMFFRTRQGRRMTPQRFGEIFKAGCIAAGLDDDLTAHGLRHAGASEAAENGASVPKIAALLGDRSWQMAQRYASQAEKKRMVAEYHAERARAGT